jgi:hypothetical protein
MQMRPAAGTKECVQREPAQRARTQPAELAPQAVPPRLRQLQALSTLIDSSPRVMQHRALAAQVDDGPRMQARRDAGRTVAGAQSGLPAQLKAGIESLSGIAMDGVKVHYNSPEPARMNAHAYAQGSDIHIAPGQERHLPHEAWHVVQQAQGRVRPTMQLKGGSGINDDPMLESEADAMGSRAAAVGASEHTAMAPTQGAPVRPGTAQLRRLPRVGAGFDGGVENLLTDYALANPGDLLGTVPQDSVNFAAHSEGLRLLLERVRLLCSGDVWTNISDHARGLQSQEEFDALPEREQLIRKVRAVLTLFPAMEMGLPSLIESGARPGTNDAANIQALVDNANTLFDAVAAGRDHDLQQVFGATNVPEARARYASGKQRMNILHKNDLIVTDRSGYAAEIFAGGWASGADKILLGPGYIDAPDDEAAVVLLHEGMHAGNPGVVVDHCYTGEGAFPTKDEATKLSNAAHFEVVPRRIKGLANAFAGETFLPAATGPVLPGSAPTAPPPSDSERAIAEATTTLRLAWTAGLNLHMALACLHMSPASWTAPKGSGSYAASMPYWSKVMRLTIHRKAHIDHTSGMPDTRPVSEIDVALAEGFTRKVRLASFAIPQSPSAVIGFEHQHSTMEERYDAFSAAFFHPPGAPEIIEGEKNLLLKIALRLQNPITGSLERDIRAVGTLAQQTMNWSTTFSPKDPATFAD